MNECFGIHMDLMKLMQSAVRNYIYRQYKKVNTIYLFISPHSLFKIEG